MSVTSAPRSSYRHDLLCTEEPLGREGKHLPSIPPSLPPFLLLLLPLLSLFLYLLLCLFRIEAGRTGISLEGSGIWPGAHRQWGVEKPPWTVARSCLLPRTTSDSLLYPAPCTPRVWVQEPEMYWSHFHSSLDLAVLDMCPYDALPLVFRVL